MPNRKDKTKIFGYIFEKKRNLYTLAYKRSNKPTSENTPP